MPAWVPPGSLCRSADGESTDAAKENALKTKELWDYRPEWVVRKTTRRCRRDAAAQARPFCFTANQRYCSRFKLVRFIEQGRGATETQSPQMRRKFKCQ